MWFLSWADVFWQLFLDCDWVISQGKQIVHINRIARHEEFISNEIAQKCSLLTEDPNNRLTPTNRSSWVAIHTHPPDLVRLLYTGSSKVAIHQIWCTCYSRTTRSAQPDLVGQGPCPSSSEWYLERHALNGGMELLKHLRQSQHYLVSDHKTCYHLTHDLLM